MNSHFIDQILQATGASECQRLERIQELWSGYGEIARFELIGSKHKTVVVKHVCLPEDIAHPRGWNTNLSHQRKLKSYAVETAWYGRWSKECSDACRVPKCLACESIDDEILIILEDLDANGFSIRKTDVNLSEINACLNWLAHFHATFLGASPEGLWPVGTYWHLETRPDELKVLKDKKLKQAADKIDAKLNGCRHQTFVHGDAKLANFCFSAKSDAVAAVDFQYVGGGCGMKDVAYFIGSCLYEDECERLASELLETYFQALETAVKNRDANYNTASLIDEWRQMFPIAWTDFHRFIKGWSPGHWKINSYSERLAREVLEAL